MIQSITNAYHIFLYTAQAINTPHYATVKYLASQLNPLTIIDKKSLMQALM